MRNVAVVLTENYADWECGFLLGAGRAYYGLAAKVVTPGGGAVRSMGGVTTLAGADLSTATPRSFDVLAIAGGAGWEENEFSDVIAAAERFLDQKKVVAAICGATLGLARAGVLDLRHTSNSRDFLKKARAYRGERHYVDASAVRDGGLVTAPGNAPAHFAAEVFRAAGVAEDKIGEFLAMTAAEHRNAAERQVTSG